ncbi:hypothetical protein ACWPN4_23065 [Gordonia polyisoprenivorans]
MTAALSAPDAYLAAPADLETPESVASQACVLSAWAPLSQLLTGADIPVRVLGRSDVDNEPVPVAAGSLNDMYAVLDDRSDTAALVAPLRPDLVVVDLDGCAGQVLPLLRDAAAATGGVLVYRATSGSADSEHAAWAFPTSHGWAAFVDAIAAVRSWAGLDARAVDVIAGGRGVRLPGSASLKAAGGRCVPLDLDDDTHDTLPCGGEDQAARDTAVAGLSPAEALRQTAAALASVPVIYTPPLSTASPADNSPADVVATQWRPRKSFTPDQRAALEARPTAGERSEAAVAAFRALWEANIRDWAAAQEFFDLPVFAKYRERRDRGQVFFQAQLDRWATFRGDVDPADQAVCDQWLVRAGSWIDHPHLEAALHALVRHRFTDGRGLHSRPISCRDLAQWLHAGITARTASRYLQELTAKGVLDCVRRSGYDTDPTNAHHYTLRTPGTEVQDLYPGGLAHDRTPPPSALPLHPLWSVLGQRCRQLYQALTPATPSPTAVLATQCGLPTGDHTSGALAMLHRLHTAGLITRVGRGRGTTWTRTGLDLDEAATTLGAPERATAAAAVTAAERRAWHAPDQEQRRRALAALTELRRTCDEITTTYPDLAPKSTPPATTPPDPSPRPTAGGRQLMRAARTALTDRIANALTHRPAHTPTDSSRKDNPPMPATNSPHRDHHPPQRRRTSVSRAITPAPWICVTDAKTFARHLQAGRRRIEVRRTVLDPPQDGLIALGNIPDGVQVRITGCAAVLVTGGAVHATDTAHVEAHGTTTVHTYGRATAIGFDTTTLTGHHRSQLQLCDRARAAGTDQTSIIAWDPEPAINAGDHTRVIIAGPKLVPTADLHLHGDAQLYSPVPCTPTGPARSHITHTVDPFAAAGIEPTTH